MNEEKKTPESDAVNGNKICHPARDGEQQQQAAAVAATAVQQHTTQQQACIYEYILVRRAAAYSTIFIVDQVQVLCCETAHGVNVKKNKKNNNTQSSSSASSTMYAYKADFSIAQTTLQSSMNEISPR